jgi:YesN/AraC family two-component response regulator
VEERRVEITAQGLKGGSGMPQAHILLVDDEPMVREVYQKALEFQSWTVEVAGDGQEALEMLHKGHFDVTVLDLVMPHLSGMEVLEAIRKEEIRTSVIVLTGYGDVEMSFEAGQMGAQGFLSKSLPLPEFIAAVRKALEARLPFHVRAEALDAYLKERASDPALREGELCERFHVSTRYVSRLFREHLGATFPERLAHHRVQRAKQLLETTDEPLYRIADQCGFRDRRRLSEAFRKQEGMTPRQYRKICAEKRTIS